MNYKVSSHCRLCLRNKIKRIFSLKPIPLGEKYFNNKIKSSKTLRYPYSIGFCKKCKNIQTMEVIKNKFLWKNYTYFSSQTKSIVSHFKNVSKIILKKYKISEKNLIIDIGSNDGSLLQNFKKRKIRVLGIDPAKNVANFANKLGINTLVGIFNKKIEKKILKKNGKAKIITAFNVFAHAEDLRGMLSSINNILDDNGVFIFEVQYLGDILDRRILGTFFHEHMYHHSITSLNNLFKSFDLNFYDVMKVKIQKGSIIGFVKKDQKINKSKRFLKLLKMEKRNKYCTENRLIDFKKFILNSEKKTNKIIIKQNFKKLAGYGAARSGPNLAINFGIEKKLNYLIDDHPMKKNKFSALNNLKVYPSNKLNFLKPDLCVILAYLHQRKIINKNKNYIKSNGKFLSLYPYPKIIDKKNYTKFL